MAEDAPELIFSSCIISVVISRDLSESTARDLESKLESNGAIISELKADGTIKFGEVTHIISATSDFPDYNKACEYMIPVVATQWIVASLLKNRQAPLRPYTPDPKLIFSGVQITCADLPNGDKDAIIGAVMAMGGQESSALTKLVTHIVALTEDHPKCVQAREKSLKCKIVLPHWFDDCLKLGKKIDEKPYLLPDPEILRKTSEEDVKIPVLTQGEVATTTRPDFLPTPTDSPVGPPRLRLHVFNGKKLMLADDLHLNSRLRGTIEDLVEGGGGSITTTAYKADIYVCHFRGGKDYVTASRAGKDVGNLAWIYYLITHNEWTSPMRRLLHYPIPPKPIEGFEDTLVTLSNYGGEARIYLENLVKAAGGTFTKSMKQDNTHLITARDNSEKCQAAKEWNVAMVNHLWIEESYAQCKIQSLTNKRYTHFPPRTNLGEIVGQTHFDPALLEQLYYPEDPDDSPKIDENLRPVMQSKDRNAIPPRISTEPEVPAAKVSKARRSFSASTPIRTAAAMSTPVSNRLISAAGKENDTPPSTSSRGAKDRALSKLHDLAPDLALYEKEKKRAGNGVWGGKRAADQIDKDKKLKKRDSTSLEEDSSDSDEDVHEVKRTKTGKINIHTRLLITGYKKWLDAPAKEDIDKRKLRDLGILVVQDPRSCTHLAAPSIVRTQKFLCALASGVTIVSSSFIDACISSGKVPPVEKYLLKDAQNEKRFKLKLKDVVKRATANARHLLDNVAIYCTADISNGPETYKAIIEANGGEFGIFRGRSGTLIPRANPGLACHDREAVYLLSSTKPDEVQLWPKFEQMARDAGFEPRVVHAEWLLDTAMSQEIRWNNSYLAVH